MKPIPEKLVEFEHLYQFNNSAHAQIIYKKLIQHFPYDFELSADGVIGVGSGLDNKNWGIVWGFCFAWENILEGDK